jgi:hypothetical protein
VRGDDRAVQSPAQVIASPTGRHSQSKTKAKSKAKSKKRSGAQAEAIDGWSSTTTSPAHR